MSGCRFIFWRFADQSDCTADNRWLTGKLAAWQTGFRTGWWLLAVYARPLPPMWNKVVVSFFERPNWLTGKLASWQIGWLATCISSKLAIKLTGWLSGCPRGEIRLPPHCPTRCRPNGVLYGWQTAGNLHEGNMRATGTCARGKPKENARKTRGEHRHEGITRGARARIGWRVSKYPGEPAGWQIADCGLSGGLAGFITVCPIGCPAGKPVGYRDGKPAYRLTHRPPGKPACRPTY